MDSVDAAVESFSEELVAARPALFRFAVTLTSMSEAEDLVQDALTRAWLKREQYRAARGSVRAWALAIVADQASTRRRRRRFPAVHLDDSLPVPSPVDDAVSSAALDLSTAINALPARQRLAIVLSVYVDLPLADVAVVMGCSLGTVKATLHHARTHLASVLGATYALD